LGREALAVTISIVFTTALLSAVFKYVPDAEIEWEDVRIGAFVTAILFELGKYFLSVYLARTGIAGIYEAAGSLALILLFVSYASMLLLLGAEFTHRWTKRREVPIRPARGAIVIHDAA
jgi:membrane protein